MKKNVGRISLPKEWRGYPGGSRGGMAPKTSGAAHQADFSVDPWRNHPVSWRGGHSDSGSAHNTVSACQRLELVAQFHTVVQLACGASRAGILYPQLPYPQGGHTQSKAFGTIVSVVWTGSFVLACRFPACPDCACGRGTGGEYPLADPAYHRATKETRSERMMSWRMFFSPLD